MLAFITSSTAVTRSASSRSCDMKSEFREGVVRTRRPPPIGAQRSSHTVDDFSHSGLMKMQRGFPSEAGRRSGEAERFENPPTREMMRSYAGNGLPDVEERRLGPASLGPPQYEKDRERHEGNGYHAAVPVAGRALRSEQRGGAPVGAFLSAEDAPDLLLH